MAVKGEMLDNRHLVQVSKNPGKIKTDLKAKIT